MIWGVDLIIALYYRAYMLLLADNNINVALNKKATQVGDANALQTADKAVDGNKTTVSCTGTNTFRWWCVDLGILSNVFGITVFYDTIYGYTSYWLFSSSDDIANRS